MSVDPEYKKKIIRVIQALMPGVKIILFGSRARGDHSRSSDIDIALDAGKKLRRADVGEIRDMFMESNIIHKIDVLDYHGVSKDMQEMIDKEGIAWKL